MALDADVYAQYIEEYQEKIDECIVHYGKKLMAGLRSMHLNKSYQRKIMYLLIIEGLIDTLSTQECLTTAQLLVITEKLNQMCPSCNINLTIKTQVEIMADCVEFEEEWEDLTSGQTITLTYQVCTDTKPKVYRNGVRQDYFDEYTITGKVITFVVPFAISTGSGSSGEGVYVEYKTNYTI